MASERESVRSQCGKTVIFTAAMYTFTLGNHRDLMHAKRLQTAGVSFKFISLIVTPVGYFVLLLLKSLVRYMVDISSTEGALLYDFKL